MVNESYFNERWVLYVINNGLLNSLFSNIDVFSLDELSNQMQHLW